MIHISLQGMRFLFDHDNLKGSELLVALAVYDCAGFKDDRLVAYPGHKLIARRARISERSVRRIITKLAKLGHWRMVEGLGRGNVQGFELLKADTIMSAFKETKSGHFQHEKRSSGVDKSGQIESLHIKKKIVIEDTLKNSGDRRSKHPAIEMVRTITGRFPSKDVWDRIIREVGEHPNEHLFKTSFVNWRSHDYKPTNLTWLFEAAQSSEPWEKEQRYAQNFRDQRQNEAIKERNLMEGLRRKRSAGKEDPAKLLGSGDTDRFGQLPTIELESDISGKTFPG